MWRSSWEDEKGTRLFKKKKKRRAPPRVKPLGFSFGPRWGRERQVNASAAASPMYTSHPRFVQATLDMAPVAASLPRRAAPPFSPGPWPLDPGPWTLLSPGTYPVSPPYRRREIVHLHRVNISTGARLCSCPCAHAPRRVSGQLFPRCIWPSYNRRKVVTLRPRGSRVPMPAGFVLYGAVLSHKLRDPFGALWTCWGQGGSCDGVRIDCSQQRITNRPTHPFFNWGVSVSSSP